MAEINEEERVVVEHLLLRELESIEDRDRRELHRRHVVQPADFESLGQLRDLRLRQPCDQVATLLDCPICTRWRSRTRCSLPRYFAIHAIENKALAVLVHQDRSIHPQRIAQKLRRRLRLLDDAHERVRAAHRHRASLGAAAHLLHECPDVRAERFRRAFHRIVHGHGCKVGDDVAVPALLVQEHRLERVASEVNADCR